MIELYCDSWTIFPKLSFDDVCRIEMAFYTHVKKCIIMYVKSKFTRLKHHTVDKKLELNVIKLPIPLNGVNHNEIVHFQFKTDKSEGIDR